MGLANEDVNSLWIDPTKPELYLTVKDSFTFDNQKVDGNDIFICTLSQTGMCAYHLFWAGDQHGYNVKHLDGIGLGPLPPTFTATPQPEVTGQITDADTTSDDDNDDLDEAEANSLRIFLPLVTHITANK